jgi:hypothetical protein
MDNISYEELQESLPSFFKNYTRFELSFNNVPKTGLNGFLDLRYVKEDILNCRNIQYNKNGVDVLLPSHLVSINFFYIENFRFLYFPNSLKRIIINGAEGSESKVLFPMYNLPDLPINLLFLECKKCGLNNIPPLPQTLKFLDCSDNKSISRISELPIGLMILRCNNTTITQLPELPEGLIELTFGIGGKDKPIYFPEKLPINLEVMNIGSDECFFDEGYENDIRANPEGEVDLEPGETLTPQTIDKFLAKQKAKSDSYYTTFINPESFTEFPPNLKSISIQGTNLSSFPIQLPNIWNTTETKDFLTEYPNPRITTWNPNPIIQNLNFSIEIHNSEINLLQQKYLPLLENIKKLLIKHKINKESNLFSYYNEKNIPVNLDDLINRLQSENHASFNISVKNNPLATTQGTTIPASLNPQISQYLSSNPKLQENTIKYSQKNGGKYKKSKKNKKTKRLIFKKSKRKL